MIAQLSHFITVEKTLSVKFSIALGLQNLTRKGEVGNLGGWEDTS